MIYQFKTVDHPSANGRTAQEGEPEWAFWFSLADEGKLHVKMGQEGLEALAGLIDDIRAKGDLPARGKRKKG